MQNIDDTKKGLRLDPFTNNPRQFIDCSRQLASMSSVRARRTVEKLGLAAHGLCKADLHKSQLSPSEFADALGTTERVICSLAQQCGSAERFAQFIDDKLPDIVRAHGLSHKVALALYGAVTRTCKAILSSGLAVWQGSGFQKGPISDADLAATIERQGKLMGRNQGAW